MDGSAPMAKILKVCLQLIQALPTAPNQGPRGLHPKLILRKEGVAQGDPMAMPLYGVSMFVLSEQLKREFPSPI